MVRIFRLNSPLLDSLHPLLPTFPLFALVKRLTMIVFFINKGEVNTADSTLPLHQTLYIVLLFFVSIFLSSIEYYIVCEVSGYSFIKFFSQFFWGYVMLLCIIGSLYILYRFYAWPFDVCVGIFHITQGIFLAYFFVIALRNDNVVLSYAYIGLSICFSICFVVQSFSLGFIWSISEDKRLELHFERIANKEFFLAKMLIEISVLLLAGFMLALLAIPIDSLGDKTSDVVPIFKNFYNNKSSTLHSFIILSIFGGIYFYLFKYLTKWYYKALGVVNKEELNSKKYISLSLHQDPIKQE